MTKRKEQRRNIIKKKIHQKEEATLTQHGERFCHETCRHGSVRSKNQRDVSPRTRCVALKQSRKSEGRFPGSLELPSWKRLHKNRVFGPNESYGRAASVKPPPGAKKARIRANFFVKLQGSAWAQPLKFPGEVNILV